MDRGWMYGKRDVYFVERLDEFFSCALKHKKEQGDVDDTTICPCAICKNRCKLSGIKEVWEHLICHGFKPDYTLWIWHGETEISGSSAVNLDTEDEGIANDAHQDEFNEEIEDECHEENNVESDKLDQMMHDIEHDFVDYPEIFERLVSDSKKPLYPGCTKYTRLSAVLKLYTLKAGSGWSDKSFTALLELLKDMLPHDNEITITTYKCKKMLCPLSMEYQKIHACPNDCILYRKEYSDLQECPRCGESRYKVKDHDRKGGPAKVLWYLPIIPRFKRLFLNKKDAKYLRWHHERKKKNDNILRHVADAPQWRNIDRKFQWFGKEARNLRLGLCTDGINPYGTLSSQYSCWPVLLLIYNLPPWLCMKSKYIELSLLISGPKQPGNDIDVYLAPLIEDLKLLWNDGVTVFDAYSGENFRMHAMVYCTINDFPAYGNLSGYRLKTEKGCPICGDDTDTEWLTNCGKYTYMGHRRFLPDNHPYRKKRKIFNGKTEFRPHPFPLNGKQFHERVKNICNEFGKPYKPPPVGVCHTKRSVFWDLPYWEDLSVRHCIDVMHVEKNVFDSLIGTLLNMPNKTKDGVKARDDLAERNLRPELHAVEKGNGTYIPPACYTLSRKEKISLCECLKGIKVPYGYSSNISRLVSMKDLKLVGLKSHDCHVLMQHLLPVAIRAILPKHVRRVITKLCLFFNAICSKEINSENLDQLQADVVVTLCELEMYFPFSFFDIMVHLVVHLVREIKICGPVFQRYMYPMEREMGTQKGRMTNRYRPEGSIIEGTIACEVIGCVTDFLANVQPVGLPESRHEGRLQGVGTLGHNITTIPRDIHRQAHLHVLQHMSEVNPYLKEHMAFLRQQHPMRQDAWLKAEHNRTFAEWFKEKVMKKLSSSPKDISDTIQWLAYGPREIIDSYEAYDINGFCFYTRRQDNKSTMQNSGVTVLASSEEYIRGKKVDVTRSYYGIIEDIWELHFVTFSVPLFRCKWANSEKGVKVDAMGFTLVDFNVAGHLHDPFILASQAKQVFYIDDPLDRRRSVVCSGKRHILGVEGVEDEQEYDQFDELPPVIIRSHDMQETSDEIYVREDHNEGLWFEKKKKK